VLFSGIDNGWRKGVQSLVFGDTVAQMVHVAAARVPTRTAIVGVDEGRSLTYAELDTRSNRLAHALLGLGLAKSDRIGFWLRTSTYHVELYVAAAKAGLVAVPINERHIAREALNVIQDADIKALVFDSAVAGYVESLDLGNDCLLVSVGEAVPGSIPLEELYQGSSYPGHCPDRSAGPVHAGVHQRHDRKAEGRGVDPWRGSAR